MTVSKTFSATTCCVLSLALSAAATAADEARLDLDGVIYNPRYIVDDALRAGPGEGGVIHNPPFVMRDDEQDARAAVIHNPDWTVIHNPNFFADFADFADFGDEVIINPPYP